MTGFIKLVLKFIAFFGRERGKKLAKNPNPLMPANPP